MLVLCVPSPNTSTAVLNAQAQQVLRVHRPKISTAGWENSTSALAMLAAFCMPAQISIWKSLRPLFGSCGVFKGFKRAVLGACKAPLGPLRILKGSECLSNGFISTSSSQTLCFVIFRTLGAQKLFSMLGSVLGQMDPFGPPWVPKNI